MGQLKNTELMAQIVLNLKDLRAQKKISQLEVYHDTDINIARIESRKSNITVSTLAKLCEYYQISLGEFFEKFKL